MLMMKSGLTPYNLLDSQRKRSPDPSRGVEGWRISVFIDNTGQQPFSVLESSAELLYLVEMVDKDHHFSFSISKEQSQMMQWLIFWHASGQPNQGQPNHFGRFAPEQIPYAFEWFKAETLRVYNVLELYLSGQLTCQPREYFAGNGLGKFSIADINAYPWIQAWKRSKISEEELSTLEGMDRPDWVPSSWELVIFAMRGFILNYSLVLVNKWIGSDQVV
ncbi:hypothetical protein N7467_010374 [Penicillium canescens]|nr:hypothetical protein N7467_010374 [Penicillium canescens]